MIADDDKPISKTSMVFLLISNCLFFGIELYAFIALWPLAKGPAVAIGFILMFGWALEGNLRGIFRNITRYKRNSDVYPKACDHCRCV